MYKSAEQKKEKGVRGPKLEFGVRHTLTGYSERLKNSGVISDLQLYMSWNLFMGMKRPHFLE